MDIDIFSIDKKIRDIWTKIENDIQKIEEDIKEFKLLQSDENISSKYVKHDIEQKIKELTDQHTQLTNSLQNQHYYTIDFEELNQCSEKINIQPKKISFMGKPSFNKNDKKISRQYLDILKKYNIEYKELEELTKTPQKKEKHVCSNCRSQDFMINSEQNLEICENCGKQEEKPINLCLIKIYPE